MTGIKYYGALHLSALLQPFCYKYFGALHPIAFNLRSCTQNIDIFLKKFLWLNG